MAKMKLVFCETKTVDVNIEVEIEADNDDDAVEKAEAAYRRGEFDVALTEAAARGDAQTQECDWRLGRNETDGSFTWLV